MKFDRQAQFHPLKFLKAMAEDLTIYEHTAVSEVDGQTLHSEKGSLEAEKIIFACHFPFVNFPDAYFARMLRSVRMSSRWRERSSWTECILAPGNTTSRFEITAGFSSWAGGSTAPGKTS